MHMQVKQLKNTLSIYEPFLHKRRAFEHEKEKRILIDDARWYQLLSLSTMGANWKIYETVQELTEEEILEEIEQRLDQYMGHFKIDAIPKEYFVMVNNLDKYISGVKVHPFAEKWYVDLIGNLCAEYGLKFYGQSELYKSKNV